MTLPQAQLPAQGAGGVASVPQEIPFQPGRATVVLALSQQEQFSILPTLAGSKHPLWPHVPVHSLELTHRWSPRHHI